MICVVNFGVLLFYCMGDFYEMFFEDVLVVFVVLDIVLIKCGMYLGELILMCGVLVYVVESYLLMLICKGFCVVIVE